jgi:hypothetical protein
MKAALFVILLPLMSVLIVSLYAAGGASRTVALVLLVVSVIGTIAGLLQSQVACEQGTHDESAAGWRGACQFRGRRSVQAFGVSARHGIVRLRSAFASLRSR